MEPRDKRELDFLHFLLEELKLATNVALPPFMIKYSRLVFLSSGLWNPVVFLVFTEKESGTRIITTLNTSDVCRNHSRFGRAQPLILFSIKSITCFRPNRPSKVGKNGRLIHRLEWKLRCLFLDFIYITCKELEMGNFVLQCRGLNLEK